MLVLWFSKSQFREKRTHKVDAFWKKKSIFKQNVDLARNTTYKNEGTEEN